MVCRRDVDSLVEQHDDDGNRANAELHLPDRYRLLNLPRHRTGAHSFAFDNPLFLRCIPFMMEGKIGHGTLLRKTEVVVGVHGW